MWKKMMWCYILSLAPVVERANIAIQWIKCTPTNTFYPLDRVIRYLNNQAWWINDRDVQRKRMTFLSQLLDITQES